MKWPSTWVSKESAETPEVQLVGQRWPHNSLGANSLNSHPVHFSDRKVCASATLTGQCSQFTHLYTTWLKLLQVLTYWIAFHSIHYTGNWKVDCNDDIFMHPPKVCLS
jgi:hypothetical protein